MTNLPAAGFAVLATMVAFALSRSFTSSARSSSLLGGW